MWRPKPTNVLAMKNWSRKFTTTEKFLLDLSASICLAAKACVLLDQHRMFFECDLYSEVLSTAENNLLLTFTLQVMSRNFDMTGDKKW